VANPGFGMRLRLWRGRTGSTVDDAAGRPGIEPELIDGTGDSHTALVEGQAGRISRATEAQGDATDEASPGTVLIQIMGPADEPDLEPEPLRQSGSGGRWIRMLPMLVIAVLLVVIAVVSLAAWRADSRAVRAERDLDLIASGLSILSAERDQLQEDVDRLTERVAEADQRAVVAEEEARVQWEPLIVENEDLVTENRFLRKAIVVSSASGDVARVGLTFDGDPTPDALDAVLDALAAEGVSATFFPSGVALEANPAAWQRAVEEGHELGNGTYARTPIDPNDPGATLEELKAWDRAVAGVVDGGYKAIWFRPPLMGGFEDGVGITEVRSVIARRGLVTALWSVETFHALYSGSGPREGGPDPDAAAVTAYVVGESSPGDIVLMQFGSLDIEAVPAILRGIREKGLEVGTLSQLIDAQEDSFEGDLSGGDGA